MDGVDQMVDGRHAVSFRDIGGMGVTGCGGGAGMTEKGLDVAET